MSELGAGFPACGASASCLGVRRGRNDGEIICSFESGAIEVYNVHNQSCVRGWQLPTTEALSLAAVYHEPSARYWAVKNTKELFSWSEDAVAIGDEVVVLPSQACDLLSCHVTSKPLVVCAQGEITLGGVAKTVVGGATKKTRRKKFMLRFCELVAGGRHAVCVYNAAAQSRLSLVAIGNPLDGCFEECRDVALCGATQSEFVSACLCGEQLLIAWSSGELMSCDLRPLLHSENNITDATTLSTRHTFSPPIRLQLASVSHDYFIIADTTFDPTRLMLWDEAYATCQAKSSLTFRKLKQVFCCYGNVMCVGGEGVRMCGVKLGRGRLADALGMRESESGSSLAVVPEWVRPDQECAQWEHRIQEWNSQELTYIASLCSQRKTPTYQSFQKLLYSRWSDEAPPISLVTTPTPVIQRMLSEELFWPREELKRMLKAGLVPSSLASSLVTRAAGKEDWRLVGTALCYTALPEETIAKLLVTILDLPDQLRCYGSSIKRDFLLSRLLCQPYNDALLQQPLSEVPFSHVLLLLEFLNKYVTVKSLLNTSSAYPAPYDVILKWVWLLVDVHFTSLILSREARTTLRSLQGSISKQVEVLGHLVCVRGLCDALKRSRALPRPDSHGCLYEVEKIKLHI